MFSQIWTQFVTLCKWARLNIFSNYFLSVLLLRITEHLGGRNGAAVHVHVYKVGTGTLASCQWPSWCGQQLGEQWLHLPPRNLLQDTHIRGWRQDVHQVLGHDLSSRPLACSLPDGLHHSQIFHQIQEPSRDSLTNCRPWVRSSAWIPRRQPARQDRI